MSRFSPAPPITDPRSVPLPPVAHPRGEPPSAMDVVDGWIRLLELRDVETRDHARRVAVLTVDLARRVGYPEADLPHLRRGALLHDIGKIAVPDRILRKPGPLDDEERSIMRRHPTWARDLLAPFETLRPAIDVPWCHHERWDGGGYPRGLVGEAIPLGARVFAIVDVWDALLSERPYRGAWDDARAADHLAAGAGSHFEPGLVDAFLAGLVEPSVAACA